MLYDVLDVPKSNNCQNCTPCMRLKLMEMGFIQGQHIEITNKKLGLYLVNILSENGLVDSTIALRQEELDRICLKEMI